VEKLPVNRPPLMKDGWKFIIAFLEKDKSAQGKPLYIHRKLNHCLSLMHGWLEIRDRRKVSSPIESTNSFSDLIHSFEPH